MSAVPADHSTVLVISFCVLFNAAAESLCDGSPEKPGDLVAASLAVLVADAIATEPNLTGSYAELMHEQHSILLPEQPPETTRSTQ